MSSRIKNIINFLLKISKDEFQITLIIYLVFLFLVYLLVGEFKEVFSFNIFNLILMGIVIISGILNMFYEKKTNEYELEKNRHKLQITKKDWVFMFGLGILGAFLIFYKTKELGWLSYIISGILIILISVLVLGENDEESEKNI